MQSAKNEIKKNDEKLMAIDEMKKKLETKQGEINRQVEAVKQKIEQAEDRLKAGILSNVRDELSDSSVEKIRAEADEFKRKSGILKETSEAVATALEENSNDKKKLIESKPGLRVNFLKAAIRELSSGIDQKTKDLIPELWAISHSCDPRANYGLFLQGLFLQESMEQQMLRMKRFIKKNDIGGIGGFTSL